MMPNKVLKGCGCAFCDLDIPVYLAQWETRDVARYWHDAKAHRVECTNPKTFKGGDPHRIARQPDSADPHPQPLTARAGEHYAKI